MCSWGALGDDGSRRALVDGGFWVADFFGGPGRSLHASAMLWTVDGQLHGSKHHKLDGG